VKWLEGACRRIGDEKGERKENIIFCKAEDEDCAHLSAAAAVGLLQPDTATR